MDCKPWQKKPTKQPETSSISTLLKQPFYFLSITTLSLLLPLSFLLLARLSSANFLISSQNDPSSSQRPKPSVLFSLFLYTNPTLLHALVCIITLSSLIHTLTGRITLLPDQPARPRLHIAWIFLCTLQVCVGLGIEASIQAGVDGSGFSKDRSLLNRVMFFVGIHETMMHWSRSVVKPVVDDTLWGGPKEESWMERAALAACCGGLWWMRLREEVESLVGVVELKMETMVWRIGFGDFLCWWLYYLVVTIGVARIFKGLLWYVMTVVFKRREDGFHGESLVDVHDQV